VHHHILAVVGHVAVPQAGDRLPARQRPVTRECPSPHRCRRRRRRRSRPRRHGRSSNRVHGPGVAREESTVAPEVRWVSSQSSRGRSKPAKLELPPLHSCRSARPAGTGRCVCRAPWGPWASARPPGGTIRPRAGIVVRRADRTRENALWRVGFGNRGRGRGPLKIAVDMTHLPSRCRSRGRCAGMHAEGCGCARGAGAGPDGKVPSRGWERARTARFRAAGGSRPGRQGSEPRAGAGPDGKVPSRGWERSHPVPCEAGADRELP